MFTMLRLFIKLSWHFLGNHHYREYVLSPVSTFTHGTLATQGPIQDSQEKENMF